MQPIIDNSRTHIHTQHKLLPFPNRTLVGACFKLVPEEAATVVAATVAVLDTFITEDAIATRSKLTRNQSLEKVIN